MLYPEAVCHQSSETCSRRHNSHQKLQSDVDSQLNVSSSCVTAWHPNLLPRTAMASWRALRPVLRRRLGSLVTYHDLIEHPNHPRYVNSIACRAVHEHVELRNLVSVPSWFSLVTLSGLCVVI